MISIRLDNLRVIPDSLQHALSVYSDVLGKSNSIEELCDNGPLRPIAVELHQHIYNSPVCVYHCTKEPEPGYFRRYGLRVLNRQRHQVQFLEKFGNRFTTEERTIIEKAWENYFSPSQDNCRNGRISFCFTPHLVINNGTDVFFKYFGGEAIFIPLKQFPSIMAKLGSIGEPVVVEFSFELDAGEPYTRFSLAITLLSHYHVTQNCHAHIYSKQGFASQDIPPEKIVAVSPKDAFFSQYSG